MLIGQVARLIEDPLLVIALICWRKSRLGEVKNRVWLQEVVQKQD